MENYTEIMETILQDSDGYNEIHERGIVQPIYWSEDKDGNINFDVDSIREEFERFLSQLEEHNESSDFDWDNL
jgi:hypothetical protein